MALTYTESADLMNDAAFRNRVMVACLKFADYIAAEGNDVPAHNTRLRWANACMQNPQMTAVQVTPTTVMQDGVQEAGAEITDADLQIAVETAVNQML
jgi:hypothetical protein